MSVIIHYEGQLHSHLAFSKMLDILQAFTIKNRMDYFEFENRCNSMLRSRKGKLFEYTGPTKGIIIYPGFCCEMLLLEFDQTFFVEGGCETQYADISIHIRIIELLQQIESYFSYLLVQDEGEYWEKKDKLLLQSRLNQMRPV
ncbi:MAG: hypothetical protein ACJ75B_05375 [Flavisolibacter sp.]